MIQKCLFPAAGYGTRFLPVTKAVPKELLPILTKPLIQYGVEEALAAGMPDIGIVTGHGKQAIESYFDHHFALEHKLAEDNKSQLLENVNRLIDNCSFSYTRQRQMRGLGHAILTGEPLIGKEAFAVILADDLCVNSGPEGGVLEQMAALYQQHQCSIVAIEEVPKDEVSHYGVIAGEQITDDLYQITDMVEKPAPDQAPSNLAIIGRYILTPDIFDILRDTPPGKNNEIQITDALKTQATEGKVLAYRFKGQRFDCGSINGFMSASNHFFNQGQA